MDNKVLIDTLSARLGTSNETVVSLIEGLIEVIGDKASDLDSISITGFGNFEPRKRIERVALHPANGHRLLVPPKITLSFKPSPLLKQKIRK